MYQETEGLKPLSEIETETINFESEDNDINEYEESISEIERSDTKHKQSFNKSGVIK